MLITDKMTVVYMAMYFYVAFSMDCIRIYSGPLPAEICWIYKLAKNWAAHGGMVLLMTMTVVRVIDSVYYEFSADSVLVQCALSSDCSNFVRNFAGRDYVIGLGNFFNTC